MRLRTFSSHKEKNFFNNQIKENGASSLPNKSGGRAKLPMNRKATVKRLQECTSILQTTFDEAHIKILAVGITDIDKDGDCITVLVEFISTSPTPLKDSFEIGANFYDADGHLIANASSFSFSNFKGIKTIQLSVSFMEGIVEETQKIRLFLSQG